LLSGKPEFLSVGKVLNVVEQVVRRRKRCTRGVQFGGLAAGLFVETVAVGHAEERADKQ
jgi:hypothetical protein